VYRPPRLKALLVVVLSSTLSASGWLSFSHLLQENAAQPVQISADAPSCQPGRGHGLVPDHARLVSPIHLCAICKNFKGTVHVDTRLTVPPFTPAANGATPHRQKLHFAGFSRLSRSPPAQS